MNAIKSKPKKLDLDRAAEALIAAACAIAVVAGMCGLLMIAEAITG